MSDGAGDERVADLVLEGGGVKGIALVGALDALEAAGYTFGRIAGTSAGAAVGALVAAGMPADRRREVVRSLDYARFRDRGLLDRLPLVGPGLSVLLEEGVYEGDALRDWLAGELEQLGVRTFADLRIPPVDGCLPPERAYRLVVLASDVSRGRLVRLPWDYPDYGLDPDAQPVADAVRASASIPFFYEPVRLRDRAGVTSYVVDGGLLSNFPVSALDRLDGRPPSRPTFGLKLSARPDVVRPARPIDGPLAFAAAIVATLVDARDHIHIDEPHALARTVFIDTAHVRTTQFDLSPEDRDLLYANGGRAVREFLAGWDFEAYVRRYRGGGSPGALS